MKNILILCLILMFTTSKLYSQTKNIYGKTISDDLEIMSYIFISINDTIEVGKTDLNGTFQVEVPVYAQKISFSSVGFETAHIEIVDDCNKVEVIMLSSSTYDFLTPKRVNKLLFKEFKKLPSLHEQAFNKGIFEQNTICYKREFVRYYHNRKLNKIHSERK